MGRGHTTATMDWNSLKMLKDEQKTITRYARRLPCGHMRITLKYKEDDL